MGIFNEFKFIHRNATYRNRNRTQRTVSTATFGLGTLLIEALPQLIGNAELALSPNLFFSMAKQISLKRLHSSEYAVNDCGARIFAYPTASTESCVTSPKI